MPSPDFCTLAQARCPDLERETQETDALKLRLTVASTLEKQLVRRIAELEGQTCNAEELRQARADATSSLDLVSRIREALGDNGTRMQDELLVYCRELVGRRN